MQIGAGAPWDFWQIGAKAACTNPSKKDTVKTVKVQEWIWTALNNLILGGKRS